MSLADAVSRIADNMDKDAAEIAANKLDAAVLLLRSYARELRNVVTAADNALPLLGVPAGGIVTLPNTVDRIRQHRKEEQRRQAMEEMSRQEERGFRSVDVIGGPAAPDDEMATSIQADVAMPVGAKTVLSGGVYVLKDDHKLHYDHAETEKFKAQVRV